MTNYIKTNYSDAVRVTYNGTQLTIELLEQEKTLVFSNKVTKFELARKMAEEIEEAWLRGAAFAAQFQAPRPCPTSQEKGAAI